MKKVYLVLLMLVAVALSASATKHSRLYSFERNSPDWQASTGSTSYFQWTNYTYVSFLAGYQGKTGQQYKTETVVRGYDNRFAFYTTRWHWRRKIGKYYDQEDNNYLRNDVNAVNIFSVLNLRAGDIVRIKCNDSNNDNAVQDRFITAHSPNAIDNRPWDDPSSPLTWLNQAIHEFIMQEDGNLDLNCAPDMELVSVEVVNPFEEYNYWRNDNNEGQVIDPNNQYSSQLLDPDNKATFNHFKTVSGGEIVTQQVSPMDEDHNTNADGPYWTPWTQPIVQFRGDIHPTDAFSATIEDGTWSGQKVVRVSGFEGKGGAVVIMYERYMWVYTIPYEVDENNSKSWNFWSHKLDVGYSTEDGSEGPEFLSLQHHDNAVGVSAREELYRVDGGKTPVYTTRYQDFMKAQNAFVNEETAGLMFWTRSWNENGGGQTKGMRSYGYNNEYQIGDKGVYEEDGDGYRYLTLLKGCGFTIPNLKAGDQVYIYMAHSENTLNHYANNLNVTRAGVKFKVWNAKDALKKDITDGVTNSDGYQSGMVFTGGSNWGPRISTAKWGRQYYGALHFYAAKDGDMHFLMDGSNDVNFVKLCYIRIYRNTQDIIVNTDELLGQEGYEVLVRQNPDGSFETPETRTFNLRTTNTVSKYQQFEVLECSGNLSSSQVSGWSSITMKKDKYGRDIETNPTVWNLNVSTTDNKPLYGAFLLRGKDMDHNNRYCMNYSDRVVAIGTLQQMNYPFTWNFKDILASAKGNSGAKFTADAGETTLYQDSTRIWTSKNGIYEMNNSAFENGNRNWSSGSQLYAYDEFIEEAAGVGFATWNQGGGNGNASHNGDIAITANGVRIQPQHQYGMTRVFLPKLKENMKVFIQGKRYVGGKSGFGAYYLTGKAYTPRVNNPWNENRYHDNAGYDEDNKWSENDLLSGKIKEMNIIKGSSEDEIKYDNFLYNFSSLDLVQEEKVTTESVDEHMDIVASAEKTVELTQTAPSTVSNSLFQLDHKDGNRWYAKDENGLISDPVRDVDTYGNIIINGPQNDAGALVFDSESVTLEEDGNTYTNVLKLGGAGSSDGRVIQIKDLNAEKEYDITVVLKSQNSDFARELAVYGGNWGGTELGTMLARNKVMAKSIKGVSGYSTITIGSKDSGIEIYAVYVRQSNQPTGVDEIPFIAYIDMKDAEFYSQDEINLTMYLSDVMIEHMGVSVDEKTLNAIGWASESRDYYIDHSLTEVFNAKPVKAYVATATNVDPNSNLITSITISPLTKPMQLSDGDGDPANTSGTGCIMYNTLETNNPKDRAATVSLFVPAIHDYILDSKINQSSVGNTYTNKSGNHANADEVNKISLMDGNMMIAKLYAGKLSDTNPNDEFTYYVLSYKWTDPNGVNHPTAAEEEANGLVEKFVRSKAASLKDNSAYIRLSTQFVNPNFSPTTGSSLSIVFEGEEGGADGIVDMLTGSQDNAQKGDADSYYTLSGQKINKPTVPGVYVKNGKKVFVK